MLGLWHGVQVRAGLNLGRGNLSGNEAITGLGNVDSPRGGKRGCSLTDEEGHAVFRCSRLHFAQRNRCADAIRLRADADSPLRVAIGTTLLPFTLAQRAR